MPGKYSKFRNTLQRRTDDTPYGVKLEQRKNYILENYNKVLIAEEIKKLVAEKDALEQDLKQFGFELAAQEKALAHILETTGESSFKLESGGSFFIQDGIYPTVKDEAIFYKWVDENGLSNLKKLHHKTIESIVKDALENGNPIPPGVDIFIDVKIGKRGVKEG